jgi:D-alanyl-D-alanine carboxypeptidase/D-alanyl-D-alanine-endopeptidase (penicillin-binding protein 4)
VSRLRLVTAARIALIVVLAAAAVVAGYAGTYVIRKHVDAKPAATAPPTPAAYRGASASPPAPSPATTGPAPNPAAVRRALAALASAPGLGARLRARVVDVATGTVLYDRSGSALAAPASTAKLLTAAAVLAVHPAGYRIRTRVVAASGTGPVVLVGGGDPTLTGAAAGKAGSYPEAARISDLAAQLRRANVRPTRIVVDDSLFSGPSVSPAWAPEDVPSDYGAAITATMSDGGRAAPQDAVRSSQPDLAAGAELAAALGQPNLSVSRGTAPAGARTLATVSSAPLGTLVEQMLQESDNVIAECLARQVALAAHRPASFIGAAAAVRAVLARLGVDPGAGLVDGSGLAASDRLSADTLAAVMRLVAGKARPALHTVLAGLPVAAWSGTLAHRYVSGTERAGAGTVRAKTGTLTAVSTLAGTVHDRSGQLLAFALLADRTGPTAAAESALDAIAARLAACGCA